MLLTVVLAVTALISVRFGSAEMSASEFISGLLRVEGAETESTIIYSIRLPRVAAGLVAGVGLSVSGVLLQSVTDNSLASPNIIGVNSGAGFFVILFLSLFPSQIYTLPIAAFAGAFLTTMLIVAISGKFDSSKVSIILAGIACTSVLNAGISFFSLIDSDVLTSYNYFSIGGFSGVKLKNLLVPAAIIALCVLVSLCCSRSINILCLGDSVASSLGVGVKRLRMMCLICASASAAAVVSYAGLLGFVGLVVPHIARRLVGNSTRHLIVTSMMCGGILVMLADLLGRILFAPSEIPVGIVMSLIGAPFFLALLLKKRGNL